MIGYKTNDSIWAYSLDDTIEVVLGMMHETSGLGITGQYMWPQEIGEQPDTWIFLQDWGLRGVSKSSSLRWWCYGLHDYLLWLI
jgi:hypothetical protein